LDAPFADVVFHLGSGWAHRWPIISPHGYLSFGPVGRILALTIRFIFSRISATMFVRDIIPLEGKVNL
jgi:hypothetical protein